ncbi:MAG: bifunctional phosphopantothenoylcysteine decarboxylase/phosphopantothenate--cysteine ligase CoaBC [Sphingobacteriales bacterium]|nr:MAG: bifunctional phosphopantothenoylcysteine decarboxylase/phosphopantothenate--cysteine ligase CoaBC [Sphingobacteriales bacterium]
MQLKGKKIILAVTGSIAAYKTPQLVRLLIKAGAEVRVLMTQAAADFVSPLALSTVSRNPVFSNVSDGSAWNNHVELGRWADAMLIAPCSANSLAKLALGLCDNLVCAVYLSAICPVYIAPAMDEDMWMHPSVKANVSKLKSYGNILVPVAYGELASGLIGEGRMAEPEDLVDFMAASLSARKEQPLSGTKALVTAGPTFERIDPVRFIGNFSTGKMGIAIAEALADKGAEVTLVLGPTHLATHHPRITTVSVESADEMYESAMSVFPDAGISVLAAAVADFKAAEIAREKIKKSDSAFQLTLKKNRDILATLGGLKKDGQLLVGFALETNNEEQNALKKLREKNADMIVLNSLKDAGAGFGHDTNKVTLLDADGGSESLPLQSKKEAAEAIVKHILELKYAEKVV